MTIDFISLIILSSAIAVLAREFYRSSARAGLPPVLTSLLMPGLIIYISCLVPGILSCFRTIYIQAFFLILTAGILFTLKFNHVFLTSESKVAAEKWPAKLDVSILTLLTAGLVLSTPALYYLRYTLPSFFIDTSYKLEWDVAAYHLPSMIGFLKTESLWRIEDPYQSYSFGFELISLFLSLPFHSHWGIGLGSLYAMTMMLAAISDVAKTLTSTHDDDMQGASLTLTALAFGIWVSIFPSSITDIGKNDIFMCASLLGGFAYMLRTLCVTDENQLFRLRFMAGIGFGLALATKPSSFLYLPFLVIANGYVYSLNQSASEKRRIVNMIHQLGLPLAIALLIGGFWLLRNLLTLGELTPFKEAFNLSLLANIYSIHLLDDRRSVLLTVLSLGVMVPVIIWCIGSQKDAVRSQAALVTAFHVNCLIALLVTPHVLSHNAANKYAVWQIRLVMPLFASSAILVSVFAIKIVNRYLAGKRPVPAFIMGCILFTVLNITIAYRYSAHGNHAPSEVIDSETEHASVRKWINSQSKPVRIYSIGMAPYELYGTSWANALFYDLHATTLAPTQKGVIKIAALLRDFKPDYIVISKQAPGFSSETESLIQWMGSIPKIFEETSIGDFIVLFRVHPEHQYILYPLIPVNYQLSMGG